MEKDLSPQESLSIIRSMIDKTRHSISDHSHYFLLWGYAVFLGCAIQFYLLSIKHPQHYQAWWITAAAMVIQFYFIFRDSKKENVSTFVGEATGFLWIGLGVSFIVCAFIFGRIGFRNAFPIYILLYAIGTFVSGHLLSFKPLFYGGMACFVLAALAAYVPYDMQILITAISILISYIIPGHLLRMQYRKQKSLV